MKTDGWADWLVSKWQAVIFTQPVMLSWLLFMTVFHTAGLIFEVLDRRQKFPKHKQFHGLATTPNYANMLPTVLFNQVFLLLPLMKLFTEGGLAFTAGFDAKAGWVGQAKSYVACMTIAPLIHEVMFYTAHRYLLHSRWGFTRLNHALHHTSRAHSAISAMYMSATDFVLEVVLPYLLPLAALTRMEMVTRTHAVLMLPVGTLGGLYEHSGYNFFPMLGVLDTRTHGLHHTHHTCSFADGFGSTNLLDHLFQTSCSNYFPAMLLKAGLHGVTRMRGTGNPKAKTLLEVPSDNSDVWRHSATAAMRSNALPARNE